MTTQHPSLSPPLNTCQLPTYAIFTGYYCNNRSVVVNILKYIESRGIDSPVGGYWLNLWRIHSCQSFLGDFLHDISPPRFGDVQHAGYKLTGHFLPFSLGRSLSGLIASWILFYLRREGLGDL